ncbi:MAG: hypothetical protein OXH86_07855 [Acidimicrobiaceae bacterium]|nr:hypothetical protein [Acidimicrobiaceae bacterium]MDE0497252.1 hypothetical protein [Acidimicrobiaceae bacterium]
MTTVALAAPAGAQADTSNATWFGPNRTLVLADCSRSADTSTAVELAAHARNAAAACLSADGVPAETAALIADFRPDRVLVVGGPAAVPPGVMDELSDAVRSAYRWAVVQRLGGATRADTAAAAARVALDTPERAGHGAVTLVVADGWDDADIDTARAFAATLHDVAIVYFSPAAAADGLPEATASLIADYRPARIVFAGPVDEAGLAGEAAAEAVLSAIESDVVVERVALASAAPAPAVNTTTLAEEARETFEAIGRGERIRRSAADADDWPFLALTKASGVPGVGSTLFTLRADGSDRVLRTVDHNGWEWHPSDGRLAWSDDDRRVMAATPEGEVQAVADESAWPLWSPDGSRLIVFDLEDIDGDGWTDRAEAFMSDTDGSRRRSLGFVDLRTWYYANISGGMWSPDGSHIAYVTGDIDPETMELVRQARIEPADAGTPAVTLADDAIIVRWSPDSRHLLYATPNDCDGDETNDSWNLHVAAADGSAQREIGVIDFDAWSVLIINLWSPDGKHFAYRGLDPQDCSTDIYVATVDEEDHDGEESQSDAESVHVASQVHIVADARFLGWSPDSTYLEYGVETDRPVTDYLLAEQSWIAHRDGSSKRFIGEVLPSAYGWVFWSHDGAYISYSEILRDADGSETGLAARIERTDGTSGVTTLAEAGNSLSWSDDGRAAYVAQHDDDGDGVPEREALYLRTPGSPGDDVKLVHALPAPTRVVIWSPDSSHLIYASGSIESLIGWFRNRGRGASAWGIATAEPRWMHRLTTDVTWGEWQPTPGDG